MDNEPKRRILATFQYVHRAALSGRCPRPSLRLSAFFVACRERTTMREGSTTRANAESKSPYAELNEREPTVENTESKEKLNKTWLSSGCQIHADVEREGPTSRTKTCSLHRSDSSRSPFTRSSSILVLRGDGERCLRRHTWVCVGTLDLVHEKRTAIRTDPSFQT